MSDEQPIHWWRNDLGAPESERIAEAIRRRQVTQGAVVAELENRIAAYLDVPYVSLTASGSAALLAALLACGIGPGDEVLVPAFSFVATANAPLLLGARVRLVDVEKDRPVIDTDAAAEACSAKTKAIVPVHLNGRAANISGLERIAEKYSARLIEDAAQAFGSRDAQGYLGLRGSVGCFSTSITKLLTTGEGGFATTFDEKMHERLRRVRNQGADSLADGDFSTLGFNLRQNDIMASLGLAQFERIERHAAAMRRIYRVYRDELAQLHFLRVLPVNEERGELPLWVEVLCAEREKVIASLRERNIQAKAFGPALCDLPHIGAAGEFPHARFFAKYGMILPSGPSQTEADVVRTIEALKEIGGRIEGAIE